MNVSAAGGQYALPAAPSHRMLVGTALAPAIAIVRRHSRPIGGLAQRVSIMAP
jgi:hypothetical protein